MGIFIKELPRVSLCNLPTPLQEAPRLSARLGGTQVSIKRDDLTGLAMGGNKSRKLEFIMADAKGIGADVVITAGTPQSNEAFQTLAAASKLGMDTILFIFKMRKDTHNEIQSSFLYHLLAAKIRLTDLVYDDLPILSKKMQDLADVLRARGHRPYVLHPAWRVPLGIVGYVCLAGEICNQLRERGLAAQYLFLASASGQTQAGLTLGAKYFGAPFKVIGITPTHMQSREEMVRKVADLANETARFLEMSFTFEPDEIVIHDEYASEKRSPTRGSIEAIKLVAQTEGIFLDPIYTGKAMAALVDQTQRGKIKSSDAVIFYHTGGLPAIFEYGEALLQGL
jgi:1-aminocyclopropane-1-carboxylate deaminase/D-cysteine desulfhydrase-like pyridoxal-dependent ACC family enzyme